jgi:hypothetical protein
VRRLFLFEVFEPFVICKIFQICVEIFKSKRENCHTKICFAKNAHIEDFFAKKTKDKKL